MELIKVILFTFLLSSCAIITGKKSPYEDGQQVTIEGKVVFFNKLNKKNARRRGYNTSVVMLLDHKDFRGDSLVDPAVPVYLTFSGDGSGVNLKEGERLTVKGKIFKGKGSRQTVYYDKDGKEVYKSFMEDSYFDSLYNFAWTGNQLKQNKKAIAGLKEKNIQDKRRKQNQKRLAKIRKKQKLKSNRLKYSKEYTSCQESKNNYNKAHKNTISYQTKIGSHAYSKDMLRTVGKLINEENIYLTELTLNKCTRFYARY